MSRVSWFTVEWEREPPGLLGRASVAAGQSREWAADMSENEAVAQVHLRVVRDPVTAPVEPSDRAQLATAALGPWTKERAGNAGYEVEALATALLDAEAELRLLRTAILGYDTAELASDVDRNRFAEKLRRQIADTINAEADLIVHQADLHDDDDNGRGASLTVVCGILAGANEHVVADAARLPVAQVAEYAARLRANSLWQDGRACIDADVDTGDGTEMAIWLALASLVADGKLVRLPDGSHYRTPAAVTAEDPSPTSRAEASDA